MSPSCKSPSFKPLISSILASQTFSGYSLGLCFDSAFCAPFSSPSKMCAAPCTKTVNGSHLAIHQTFWVWELALEKWDLVGPRCRLEPGWNLARKMEPVTTHNGRMGPGGHGESMDRNHSACFRNLFVGLLVGRSVRLSVVPPGPRSELCGRLECL